MSDKDPAGRETRIPGRVEAAAMRPRSAVSAPRLRAKGTSTGFLAIVELRIASAPAKLSP